MARDPMTPDKGRRYWRKTSRLMWIVLTLWAAFGLAVPLSAAALNSVVVLGFPLGYYMAAQGSLIGFVAVIFWYARRQNDIDEEFDLAED